MVFSIVWSQLSVTKAWLHSRCIKIAYVKCLFTDDRLNINISQKFGQIWQFPLQNAQDAKIGAFLDFRAFQNLVLLMIFSTASAALGYINDNAFVIFDKEYWKQIICEIDVSYFLYFSFYWYIV